eukprot:g7372.t1
MASRFDGCNRGLMVRGAGFFNDAYDLFVMNIVNVVLKQRYPDTYTTTVQSEVATAVFVGAVVGQIAFGVFADRFGRHPSMVLSCTFLVLGGVLCAVASSPSPAGTLVFLAVARGILGFGIGGEYPNAATSTAEASESRPRERGKSVALVFSMQGVGQFCASVAGVVLVFAVCPHPDGKGTYDDADLDVVWRTLFALGVLPALLIFRARCRAKESGMFRPPAAGGAAFRVPPALALRHYGRRLLGTAGSWFLFDIVFYANALFSAEVLGAMGADEGEDEGAGGGGGTGDKSQALDVVVLKNLCLAAGALPGYFVAAYTIDRVGRRRMQLLGFGMMSLIFTIMGAGFDTIRRNAALFISLYALAYFFANFGPNTTTFLLPTECFPTPIRATFHGASAAAGKLGAVLGAAAFEPLQQSRGTAAVFLLCAAVSLLGAGVTLLCVRDHRGSLADLDQELARHLNMAQRLNLRSNSDAAGDAYRLARAAHIDGVKK